MGRAGQDDSRTGMESATTRIGFAVTALAVAMTSCALPPPAEDRGLTSEVDEEFRAHTELVSRVDDRAGGDPEPRGATEPGVTGAPATIAGDVGAVANGDDATVDVSGACKGSAARVRRCA